MLDWKSVCLKLEAIICTDWIIAKDCLCVPELHRLARDWVSKCHSKLVVSSRFKCICANPYGYEPLHMDLDTTCVQMSVYLLIVNG